MYPLAHQDSRARLLVEAMLAEHELIVGLVERLRSAPGRLEAAGEARALSVTFESHLAKENDQILPLLAESPGVSWPMLSRECTSCWAATATWTSTTATTTTRTHPATRTPTTTRAHRPPARRRPGRAGVPGRLDPRGRCLVRVRGRVRLRRERRSRPARARRPVGAARHPARHHLRRPGCGELRRRSRPGRTARPPPAAEAARGTRSRRVCGRVPRARPGDLAAALRPCLIPHCRGCRALPDGAHGAVDNRTDG